VSMSMFMGSEKTPVPGAVIPYAVIFFGPVEMFGTVSTNVYGGVAFEELNPMFSPIVPMRTNELPDASETVTETVSPGAKTEPCSGDMICRSEENCCVYAIVLVSSTTRRI